MIWFRRLMALPLLALFVVFYVAISLVSVINQTLLSPEYIKQHLAKNDVYTFTAQVALPALLERQAGAGGPLGPASAGVSQRELTEVAQRVVPASLLKEVAEKTLDQVIPYLTGRTESLALSLDLRPQKQAAIREIVGLVERKTTAQLEALSPCTEQQLEAVRRGPPRGLPPCRLPDVSSSEMLQPVLSEFERELAAQLPDQFTLTERDLPPGLRDPDFQQLRRALGGLESALQIAALGLLVLWLLISLLGARSFRGKLRWGAVTLALGAGPTLLLANAASQELQAMIQRELASGRLDAPPVIAEKSAAVVQSGVQGIFGLVGDQAIPFLALAGILLVLSFLPALRRPGQPARPAEEP